MPAAGNHENELGNGPIGYQAYQTYFSLPPAADQTDLTHGLWYAFTAGAMRVISIANDDVVYQDGGNSYVRGYSKGAQKAWLEKELAAARSDSDIDWIVVCMHQVAISTVGQIQWRRPRHPPGMGSVVRQIRRRSRRMRTRAPLRALTPDPRLAVERHSDAGSCCNRHRRDRHHQRNSAHGHRRRRNVRPVEPAVLRPAGVPGHYRRRRTRPGDRQAPADLRERGRAVVGGAQRGAFLWLRRFRRSIRDRDPAVSPRSRSPITTWWGRTAAWPRSKPLRCAAPAATRREIAGLAGRRPSAPSPCHRLCETALDKRPRYSYIPASSLIRDAFARVLSDAERVRCPRAGHTPAPGRLRTPPGR